MLEAWGMELIKGIGRLFYNPLLYWSILVIVAAGMIRIRKERRQFGAKIFPLFSEWGHTWLISLLSGLGISIITLGAGIVFQLETLLVLAGVILIWSLLIRFTFLSGSYTIFTTYVLLLLLPIALKNQDWMPMQFLEQVNFQGLAILAGLFLMVEAFLIRRIKARETYPVLKYGYRGEWIGSHHIRKLGIVPFFALLPSGMITPFLPFWPYFSLGDETYSIILFPMVIGFNHVVRGDHPEHVTRRIGNNLFVAAFFVLVLAIGNIYITGLSLAAIVLALLAREWISVRHQALDTKRTPYFYHQKNGLMILAIIPGTPAVRIGIQPGEVIRRVNGRDIHHVEEFYENLQGSGAFFKLDVIDKNGEVRFVQSALYEGDHHELGIVFVKEPYRSTRLIKEAH